MTPVGPENLKGQFLIAMPALADPNFFQTVTCMCEHSPDGAMGIVVNRVHALLTAEDIFKELNIDYQAASADLPIHVGGPVHVGEIFILHGPPFGWNSSLSITPDLALSNTLDILEAIAAGTGPTNCMISLGCAGWGPGQLEEEIKQNAWLTSPVFEDVIFEPPVEDRWEAAVRKLGIQPEWLSGTAGHA
jgi:putative transcriptional regulator